MLNCQWPWTKWATQALNRTYSFHVSVDLEMQNNLWATEFLCTFPLQIDSSWGQVWGEAVHAALCTQNQQILCTLVWKAEKCHPDEGILVYISQQKRMKFTPGGKKREPEVQVLFGDSTNWEFRQLNNLQFFLDLCMEPIDISHVPFLDWAVVTESSAKKKIVCFSVTTFDSFVLERTWSPGKFRPVVIWAPAVLLGWQSFTLSVSAIWLFDPTSCEARILVLRSLSLRARNTVNKTDIPCSFNMREVRTDRPCLPELTRITSTVHRTTGRNVQLKQLFSSRIELKTDFIVSWNVIWI